MALLKQIQGARARGEVPGDGLERDDVRDGLGGRGPEGVGPRQPQDHPQLPTGGRGEE